MLIDSHSHIQFKKEFPDAEQVILRAHNAGVDKQVVVGCAPQDFMSTIEFVKSHLKGKFKAVIGVHPHEANLLTRDVMMQMEQLLEQNPEVGAIGEIGLDYFRAIQPKDVQEKAFRLQLRLAKKMNFAVVIHVRDAWDDVLRILDDEKNRAVVMHCFSGNDVQAKECLARGYLLAFGGILTYPKNESLRNVAASVPNDLILLETDSPYLPPQPYRGKRNEPAFMVETAKTLAAVRRVSLSEIAQVTSRNSLRIFRF